MLNADDPAVLKLARDAHARRLLFSMTSGLEEGLVLSGDTIVRRTRDGDQPLVPLSSVKLLGRHLVADVLAAAAVASIAGVDSAAMTRAVEGFSGLEHALEVVTEIDGVRFVNDSKATNIEAARRAIESFDDGVVVVLGGRFKGGDFKDLMLSLAERHATVVAIGESRPLIRQALSAVVSVHEAEDMSAAVRTAFASASPGRTVDWHPRVRASTCSATTRSVGESSNRKSGNCRKSGARRASNEQSSAGRNGKEPPAGNAGCPGLRGWCLCPRPADDC